MQAAQTENDRKIKELTVQVATMTKHMAEDKDVADKSIADLKAKVEERDSEIAKFRESLEKWKSGFKQATELAASKESQRAKLAQQVIELNRRVADQKAKNEAMFKIGTEMLDRYASFGLGDALTAREPFIGLTRIKFQNLIQDYGDKIADQRIKP